MLSVVESVLFETTYFSELALLWFTTRIGFSVFIAKQPREVNANSCASAAVTYERGYSANLNSVNTQ